MKLIDLAADYEVAKSQVLITIKIGDAQIGSSIVKLDATEKGRGAIKDLKIGNGPSVKGKKIRVKSVVTDVSDKTDRTSITYVLKGGSKTQEFRSSGTVEQNGASIIYRAAFNLT